MDYFRGQGAQNPLTDNNITLRILDVVDAKREALTQSRHSVLYQSCILRGEVSTHHLVIVAFGFDSLLQRQVVIFRRREEFSVELPTVNHLYGSKKIVIYVASPTKSRAQSVRGRPTEYMTCTCI